MYSSSHSCRIPKPLCVNFGTDTAIHYVVETGLPIDVTFYLSADLRSEGYTATFQSDLETPLPAALPLFATGLGALGLLGWRRKRNSRTRSLIKTSDRISEGPPHWRSFYLRRSCCYAFGPFMAVRPEGADH